MFLFKQDEECWYNRMEYLQISTEEPESTWTKIIKESGEDEVDQLHSS